MKSRNPCTAACGLLLIPLLLVAACTREQPAAAPKPDAVPLPVQTAIATPPPPAPPPPMLGDAPRIPAK